MTTKSNTAEMENTVTYQDGHRSGWYVTDGFQLLAGPYGSREMACEVLIDGPASI